jgi:hypothetical protein
MADLVSGITTKTTSCSELNIYFTALLFHTKDTADYIGTTEERERETEVERKTD